MADDKLAPHIKALSETPLDLIRMILQKHHTAIVEELRDYVKASAAERDKWRDKYHDLLMSVGQKHPDETRHETAKRYILQAEQPNDEQHASTLPETEGSNG